MSRQLDSAITSSETLLRVSPTFNRGDFPENGIIQIEAELIRYENTTESEFVQCTRGYLGTTAVAHAKGETVSIYSAVSDSSEHNTITYLLSPASIPASIIDNCDILSIETIVSDTLTLTLPSPSDTSIGRILTICHKTGSLGTLEVNSDDLIAGSTKLVIWDGSAWSDLFSAGGGGGVANPLTADLDAGAFDIINIGNMYLNEGGKLVIGNSDGSWLRYNPDSGTIEFALNNGNQTDLSTPAGFTITANTGLDGSGTYSPYLELSPTNQEIRFYSGGSFAGKFDNSATATHTRFMLYDVDSGLLQRVKVTANDAVLGVTGRVLYVDNI